MTSLNRLARIVLVGVAAVPLGAAMRDTPPHRPTSVSPGNPCSTHPMYHAVALSQIQSRFDPANTDTVNTNFLRQVGLTGLSAANVVAVTDSSKCAAAIVAYAHLSEPSNSEKRQVLRTQLPGIAVYRLSANRYLLNAGIYSRYWTHEMFVTDSNFREVSNYF